MANRCDECSKSNKKKDGTAIIKATFCIGRQRRRSGPVNIRMHAWIIHAFCTTTQRKTKNITKQFTIKKKIKSNTFLISIGKAGFTPLLFPLTLIVGEKRGNVVRLRHINAIE